MASPFFPYLFPFLNSISPILSFFFLLFALLCAILRYSALFCAVLLFYYVLILCCDDFFSSSLLLCYAFCSSFCSSLLCLVLPCLIRRSLVLSCLILPCLALPCLIGRSLASPLISPLISLVALGFDGKYWTYREVDQILNRVANWALAAGFSRGDNISLVMENCPEYIFFYLGMAKIGVGRCPPPLLSFPQTDDTHLTWGCLPLT